MNNESLCLDKKFISKQLRSVPYAYTKVLTKDEIRSELNMAIVNCAKRFDPKRGNIFPYVRQAFLNGMKNLFREKNFYEQAEVSLSAAHDLTYTEEEPEHIELMAYLSTLPDELLEELTLFALGRKNKEEIVSNPSFFRLNVERVIEKLDFIL